MVVEDRKSQEQESKEKQFLLKELLTWWMEKLLNRGQRYKTSRGQISLTDWLTEERNISEHKNHTGPYYTEFNTLLNLMCHNSHQQEAYSLWKRNINVQGISYGNFWAYQPTMLFTTLSVCLLHLGSQNPLIGFMGLGHSVLKTASSFSTLWET